MIRSSGGFFLGSMSSSSGLFKSIAISVNGIGSPHARAVDFYQTCDTLFKVQSVLESYHVVYLVQEPAVGAAEPWNEGTHIFGTLHKSKSTLEPDHLPVMLTS